MRDHGNEVELHLAYTNSSNLYINSACPRKIPIWLVLVRENFSTNQWVCRKKEQLKLIQLIFELAQEENLAVNNKDNRVFMSRNYRSDSCPLEI